MPFSSADKLRSIGAAEDTSTRRDRGVGGSAIDDIQITGDVY